MTNRLFPEQCDEGEIEYINGYPVPPVARMQPLRAARSMIRIFRDIEETSHVYDLFQAVSGKAYRRGFEQLSQTDYGRRILDGEVRIEELLSQRDWLASLPEGTVGHCYYKMVETKGFAVDGLLAAAKHAGIDVHAPTMFEAYRRYFIHFEVSHDLWHVLSGYDTDALGEICLLEVYRGQWPDIGLRLLMLMGTIGAMAERFDQRKNIRRAIREGYRHGQQADFILAADIERLLELPLKQARTELNIKEPKIYRSFPYAVRRDLQGGGATVKDQPEPVFEVGWT